MTRQYRLSLHTRRTYVSLHTWQDYIPLHTRQDYLPLHTSQDYLPLHTRQEYLPLHTSLNYLPLHTRQEYLPLHTRQDCFQSRYTFCDQSTDGRLRIISVIDFRCTNGRYTHGYNTVDSFITHATILGHCLLHARHDYSMSRCTPAGPTSVYGSTSYPYFTRRQFGYNAVFLVLSSL